MKFAAFSGVFIDYSIQEAMRMTKKLGLDGIEIAGREPHLSADTSAERVQEIKALAGELGLEIPVIAAYTGGFSTASDAEAEKQYADFLKIVDHAAVLGAPKVRVAPGGPNAFLAEEYHYAKAAYWIDRCAAAAKERQIDLVMEIHNISLVETVESSLRFLKMLKHDNVGMIHDAGNMYITDTDYGRESVLQLGNYLTHVHVKDELRIDEAGAPGTFVNRTHRGDECFIQSRLGEGAADHQPLFDALLETQYDGWITMECHAPFPAYERLEHDYKVVKQMLGLA